MQIAAAWKLLRESARGFIADDLLSQAAALAYCTALGLAPTVLLVLAVTAFLGEGAKNAMVEEIEFVVGPQAAEAVELIVRNTQQQPSQGVFSAIVGLVAVIFSASSIFAQLQSTLNLIWKVKPKETAGYGLWIRSRLLSIGMLFSVLFLMLVSMVISVGIALLFPKTGALWNLLNLTVSMGVFVFLFAIIFKVLPDSVMTWKDVWVGAAVTAFMFALGKYAIGMYLGNSGIASSFGAAGSLVALLVWVYYSAAIVFFGAELTQTYARLYGSGIKPAKYAVEIERASLPATAA